MPKRKSEQSIDEWLREGAVAAEANRALAEPSNHKEASHAGPTAGVPQDTVVTEPQTEEGHVVATPVHVTGLPTEVATTSAFPLNVEVATGVVIQTGDVAITQEDVANWFWSLLAQAGYECW